MGFGGGDDTDAAAFIEAAQIINSAQQRAIYELVRLLKQYGLWSKMKAVYPFVGGTATTHKWNLKDPRDNDAAFRLTFSGGWTHSSTGADPNGTSGYADTYLAQNVLSNSSASISYYSREASKGLYIEIGVTDNNSPFAASFMFCQFTDDKLYGALYQANNIAGFSGIVTNSQGLFLATKTSGTNVKYFRNSTSVGNQTVTAINGSTYNYYLGACRRGNGIPSVDTYSPRECAFATIGDGLTDTDATNLYNIVDLYQKRLGRAV